MTNNIRVIIALTVLGFTTNCSCGPSLTSTSNTAARESSQQVRCQCGIDFSTLAETLGGFSDQTFNLDLCLPPTLNVSLAEGDARDALLAMTDADYAAAVSAYCRRDVRGMLNAVAGTVEPAVCDFSTEVTISCTLSPIGDTGAGTIPNEMCSLPCADVACSTANCMPDQVWVSNVLHPEACKCTQATGCGLTSDVVCLTPNWMTDPPTIASGLKTYFVSHPHAATVDSSVSNAAITVNLDTGVPCGVLTDTATAAIEGTVTLFGPACPLGEDCDRLMDFTFMVDDFALDYTCAGISKGAAITSASLAGGSEGRVVHIAGDGTITIPTNTLRLNASFVKGNERFSIDTHNDLPISLHVNYGTGAVSMDDSITFADGSVALSLVARMTNRPPTARAGPDQVVECTNAGGGQVLLDGSASSDPDGNLQRLLWWQHGRALDPGSLVGSGPTAAITVPLGSTTFDLSANDSALLTAIDTTTISVADTVGPAVQLALTPTTRWPPNHKFVTVTASLDVVDACDSAPTVRLKSITSNEPANGLGDGNTAVDIGGADFGTADLEFAVRAERSGSSDGRSYTVVYEVVDHSGNVTEVSAIVAIPHDQR